MSFQRVININPVIKEIFDILFFVLSLHNPLCVLHLQLIYLEANFLTK